MAEPPSPPQIPPLLSPSLTVSHQRASRERRVLPQISMFLNKYLPDKNVLCRNENGCQKPITHLLKDPIMLLY